jgi:hypothetical protein
LQCLYDNEKEEAQRETTKCMISIVSPSIW